MHFECHAMFPMHSTTCGYVTPVDLLFLSQTQKGFRFLYTFQDLIPIYCHCLNKRECFDHPDYEKSIKVYCHAYAFALLNKTV